MSTSAKTWRTCKNGHRYYKSSDCPVCPVCEKTHVPEEEFLAKLSAPARRALENAGIKNLRTLATYTEADLLQLHGFGPSSLPRLKLALHEQGLHFKSKK